MIKHESSPLPFGRVGVGVISCHQAALFLCPYV